MKLSSEIEYRTETGESIHARYYRLNDGSLSFAKIRLPGGSEATLPNVLSASGAKYSDGRRYTWWTKGNTAFLEVRGSDGTWQLRYRDCVAIQR
ncbi:MAG: MliC family protein [Burkholderiales bacterium]|nr:MliC family protein [Burkholderiales bacterium]MDE2395727.1 MliC family protein [Burkholderiales bacterium]MDE2454489.1 MliC family protein [Burkholderiales bacterium]